MRRKPEPSSHWGLEIYNAFNDFSRDVHISQSRVLAALGLSEGNLSLSHLQSVEDGKQAFLYQAIPLRLCTPDLWQLAARMGLGATGYRRLGKLKSEVLNLCYNTSRDPKLLYDVPDREHRDLAMLGVELYERGSSWERALECLNLAWPTLESLDFTIESNRYVALRAGAMRASVLVFGPHAIGLPEAINALRRIKQPASDRSSRDRAYWIAQSLYFKTAGVVHRHEGQHPQLVISFLDRANRIALERELGDIYRIAPLRDRAKPYMQWALREDEQLSQDRFHCAYQCLDESTALCGDHGKSLSDPSTREWLLGQLTRVECLSVHTKSTEAQHVWDCITAAPWLAKLWQTHESWLSAKLRLADLALAATRHRRSSVVEKAQDFIRTFGSSPFQDKVQEAERIAELAMADGPVSWQEILQLFVR